jgi:hypothetical protein
MGWQEEKMALGHHKRAVGTFSSYQDAETALYELRDSGFSMDRVSIVGRDAANRNDMAGVNAGDRMADATRDAAQNTEADEGVKTGALAGGAVGGLTGLLVGLGALAIPGVGPVMLGGALATALASAVSGGVIGAATGGLVGGLVGLGIPEDRAQRYNDRVSRGEYLVMVEGSEEEIRRAETVLNRRGIQDWGIYDSPTGYDSPRDQPIDPSQPTGYPTDSSRAGSHTPLI